jgi:glycosyltransferase involved in cell wall biosynthesis
MDRDQPTCPVVDRLTDAGIPVHVLKLAARAYMQERSEFGRRCRLLAPDVVHSHGYRTDVLDGRLARRLGFPVVTTVHGFTGGNWKNRVFERLQIRAFRKFDAVVAVSRPLAARLQAAKVPASRLHTLPNAWSPGPPPLDRHRARQFLGLEKDFTIGWVGRLTHEKGADVLVRALSRLHALPVRVSFVGDGRERTSLERLASDLGVAERIRWHGIVSDAARVFPAFDVFVLSSRTEGTPISLFEAMAAQSPIIATSVGGVPDVVSNREAILVPADDDDALARAIERVYRCPEAAADRAEAARERLQAEFSPMPWLQKYEDVYRSVRKLKVG